VNKIKRGKKKGEKVAYKRKKRKRKKKTKQEKERE